MGRTILAIEPILLSNILITIRPILGRMRALGIIFLQTCHPSGVRKRRLKLFQIRQIHQTGHKQYTGILLLQGVQHLLSFYPTPEITRSDFEIR